MQKYVNDSLTKLFSLAVAEGDNVVIELQDKERKVVAVLYANKLDMSKVVISNVNGGESYFFYYDGLGIFWTFYKKYTV